jgi:hypothetical protein
MAIAQVAKNLVVNNRPHSRQESLFEPTTGIFCKDGSVQRLTFACFPAIFFNGKLQLLNQ